SVAPSVPPVSAHQCHIPVPIRAAFQSRLCSPIYECCLSVPISDACQSPSVPPTTASSSVPPQCLLISAHQCSLSVPTSAASLAHISEGEKSLYKIL
ncbi:unnamed protein product, partial [Staurois parvus]